MLSFLITWLLQLGLGSLSPVAPPMSKEQQYYVSCLDGCEKYLSLIYPLSPTEARSKGAREECDRLFAYVGEHKAWDKIEDPKRDGCWDIVKINMAGQSPTEVQDTQQRACGSSEK